MSLPSEELMARELDQDRNRVWRLFLTVHATVISHIERELTAADLPPLEWYDVLLALSEAPEQRLRLHELAEVVLISRSNMTRLVDRLEAAGLLRRERCTRDRRGAYAVLTTVGAAMRQQMWPIYAQGIAHYFGIHLEDDEVTILINAMGRILDDAKTIP